MSNKHQPRAAHESSGSSACEPDSQSPGDPVEAGLPMRVKATHFPSGDRAGPASFPDFVSWHCQGLVPRDPDLAELLPWHWAAEMERRKLAA
jgi:hypothetical protein